MHLKMQLIKIESAAMACIPGPQDASPGQSSSAGSLRGKRQSSWWLAVLLMLSSDSVQIQAGFLEKAKLPVSSGTASQVECYTGLYVLSTPKNV